MRVGLVCPYSWSIPGGVQSHVAGLARALNALGVDTEILAPEGGDVPLGRSMPIPSNGSVQRVALSPATIVRTARAVRARGETACLQSQRALVHFVERGQDQWQC